MKSDPMPARRAVESSSFKHSMEMQRPRDLVPYAMQIAQQQRGSRCKSLVLNACVPVESPGGNASTKAPSTV